MTIGQVNNPQIYIAGSGSATTNGILGGWAVYNGTSFAAYTAAQGVGALGAAGFPAYATDALTGGTAGDNININATVANVTGRTINSLTVSSPGGTPYVSLNTLADTLTLGSGGLLVNDSKNVGVSIGGGILTAGTSNMAASLYVFENSTTGSQMLYSQIANNTAGGSVSLVKSGPGPLTLDGLPFMASSGTWASGATTIPVPGSAKLFYGEVLGGDGLTGQLVQSFTGATITLSSTAAASAGGAGIWISFSPATLTTSTTAGSNQVTLALASTQGWTTGMAVGGTGIPAGTTISAIALSGTNYALTLSQSATATGTPTLTYGAQSNSYSGTTFVNQGTLNLSGQIGGIEVPGNLQINGGAVIMNNNAGQIAPTSNVTLGGGGSLTLIGSNVLNSVSFAGIGGTNQTSVNINGGLLTLTASNAVTAQNDNMAMTPLITGGSLAFSSSAATITTSGLSTNNLLVSAPIVSSNGPINVSGTGAVVLSSTGSTFTGGVNLNSGSIILGASSVSVSGSLTSGPLGTGTLTTANSATILAGVAAQTIGNTVVTTNDLNFGGATAANNLTLSGSVTLGGTSPTLTVPSPLVTATISGQLSGSNGLTKAGPGSVVLSNSNNAYTGSTAITAGILQATVSGALVSVSSVSVAGGAALALGAPQTIGGLSNSGNVVLNGNGLTVGAANNLNSTFSGVISDGAATGGGLTKSGTGTLVLLGSNTYSGATTVSAGTLQIGDGIANNGLLPATGVTNNATLVFANPTATTYGGAVAIGGNGSVIKTGAGKLTLGGSNTYSGPTIISGGTLQMGSFTPMAPAVQNPGFESPILANNTYTYYSGLNASQKTAFVWTSSGNGSNGGGCLIDNATAWNYPISYPGGNQAFSLQMTSTLSQSLYFLPGSYTITWSQASRTTSANPYYFQLNGVNVNSTAFSDTNTAWTTTNTTFTIPAAGTYAIGFYGTSTADNSVGLDNISISSNSATGSAQLSASTAVNITATGAAWDLNGSSQSVGSLAGVAGALVLDSGALTTGWNNSTTSFAGTISGSGSLITVGSGSLLTLTGSNSYTGGTSITAGILQLAGTGTLGSTGGALSLTGGTLDLGATAQSVLTLNGTTGTILNNGGGTAALTVGNSGSFSGLIADNSSGTGTVALVKAGTGTLTLGGTNSYSGGTTVSSGILQLGSSAALGNAALPAVGAYPLSIVTGGTLDLHGYSPTVGALTGNSGADWQS